MIPRILIVEDTELNRDVLRQFLQLKHNEWLFYTAKDEHEGTSIIEEQFAKQEPVTVLLTDLSLDRTEKDDKGGLRVIAAARKLDPFIIAILYSVHSDVDRNAAFELGAFDVIERNVPGSPTALEILLKIETALRYREFSDRIRFLSRFIDKSLIHSVDDDPQILKMQTRMVTVCFWDIQGFSKCCEELKTKPELIASFLKDYCEEAAKVIFANNGVLDKFIGDGVMALFGISGISLGNDHGASEAAAAALSLRVAFDRLVRDRERAWTFAAQGRKVQIGIRCGIHAGEALVGCAGTDFRDQFTALGECVNLASRFEQEADGKMRQILVSSSVKDLIGTGFKLTPAKVVANVKNIDGTWELFSLERE